MKASKQHSIEVYVHWAGLAARLVGTLHTTLSRGKEIFSFVYCNDWLKDRNAHRLDPALQLFQGIQYVPHGQENFNVFLDSSPDRWGRFLMDRREAQLARKEARPVRHLLESDYLLGVYDEYRMGALRFRTDPNGPFLDNNKAQASPPWTSLRELAHASLAIEKEDAYKNPNYSKWLQMLVVPGSSLGGTRPKASVLDDNKHLWIAKFPSQHDMHDVGAWEMVLHNLAQKLKITTAQANVKKYNTRHHTFMSKRFDRTEKGERIHFVSAMTLLQRTDGDNASTGTSYLEIAELIMREGSQPTQDLEQLWRRIVFFICVSNVDDHLRNHGFILGERGWILAPAYDVNPVPSANGLKLNISESDNDQDLELAKEVAAYFRLKPNQANHIIQETVKIVSGWHKEATHFGISHEEKDCMARAFRIAEQ